MPDLWRKLSWDNFLPSEVRLPYFEPCRLQSRTQTDRNSKMEQRQHAKHLKGCSRAHRSTDTSEGMLEQSSKQDT
jgi:hypothetical protein